MVSSRRLNGPLVANMRIFRYTKETLGKRVNPNKFVGPELTLATTIEVPMGARSKSPRALDAEVDSDYEERILALKNKGIVNKSMAAKIKTHCF